MIIEWLFIGILIVGVIDLILFAFIGFMTYKKIVPILEKEAHNSSLLNLMEEWLDDAYHAHPDSKTGLLQVRKQLRLKKEEY